MLKYPTRLWIRQVLRSRVIEKQNDAIMLIFKFLKTEIGELLG